MLPLDGAAVLSAAATRAAEQALAAAGTPLDVQMRRAGKAVAAAVRRLAAGAEVMIVCGPGNNGGDGYVAASVLVGHGHRVRVCAPLGEPRTGLAVAARAGWTGAIEPIDAAPVMVDALFGIGLSRDRPLTLPEALTATIARAALRIAIDLPSGVDADSGATIGTAIPASLTLALGHAKPAHLLQPAARLCGTVRLLAFDPAPADAADPAIRVIARPSLPAPGPGANKFTRGMVAIVPGPMAGAALLASEAAMRAGAGYVLLLDGGAGAPHALVRKAWSADALGDRRIGAVLIGNGLGRDAAARAKLTAALDTDRPLVIDGDALHLVTSERLAGRPASMILTPHAGEFDALFGKDESSKIDRTRDAARASGAVVVFKGADTVIADPDGRVVLAGEANAWLSTAGSGDVLAGTIAAQLAATGDAFAAAQAGVWLHSRAARRLGAAFIADDLPHAIGAVRAAL